MLLMNKIIILDTGKKVMGIIHKQLVNTIPHEIVLCSSLEKAQSALSTGNVDVLIMHFDASSPSDLAFLENARKNYPTTHFLLVVNKSHTKVVQKAQESGMIHGFLTKPWDKSKLISMVKCKIEMTQTLQKQLDKSSQPSQTSHPPPVSVPRQSQSQQPKVSPKTRLLKLTGIPPFITQPLPLRLRQSQRLQLIENINKQRVILAQNEQTVLANRYKLLELHGEGGLGKVYKAEDTLLGIPVAVKILHPSLTTDSSAVNDLKQEARIAMQLSHSHIVRLYNLDKHQNKYFLVMEYVPGRSLRTILQVVGKLSLGTVSAIIQVCGNALSFAHAQKVLHKDLKPDNMIVTEDGILKIVDFSISSFIGFKENSDYVAGTLAYMSPEQITGETLDVRTDIYSLGIVAYELLTGVTPFPDEATAKDILTIGYVPLHALESEYKETKEVLKKAVVFDRNKRWKEIQEFAEAFVHASAIDAEVNKKESTTQRQRRLDYSNKPTARIKRQHTRTQEP